MLKRFVKFLISLCVSVGLLIYVAYQIDFAQMKSSFRAMDWPLVVVFWFLSLFCVWLVTFRLSTILKYLNCPTSTNLIFRASFITALYSFILPGGLSNSVKWYILKKHTGKGAQVLASMFYNQVVANAVALLTGLIALMIENPTAKLPLDFVAAGVFIVALVVLVVLLSPAFEEKLSKVFFNKLAPKLPGWIGKLITKLFTQLNMFRIAGARFHFKIFGMCLLTRIIAIVATIIAAKAASINVPVTVIVWQSSIIFILALLPISIMNLGPREVTLVATLGIYGVSAEQAITLSTILFSIRLIQAFAGAVCQLPKLTTNITRRCKNN